MLEARFETDATIRTGTIEGDVVVTGSAEHRLDDVTLLAPCSPTKIIGCGLNYMSTIENPGIVDDPEVPERPYLFFKPPSSVIGHGDAIVEPETSGVHYEGELAIVIDESCRSVPAEEALKYVRGYTCMNDVTATDWTETEEQWVRTKGSDTFSPLGPYLQTDVEGLESDLGVETRVNGEIRQRTDTGNTIFSVAELIADITENITLEPGDVIATGTPSGVGTIEPGDTVEVTVETVGTLWNEVK